MKANYPNSEWTVPSVVAAIALAASFVPETIRALQLAGISRVIDVAWAELIVVVVLSVLFLRSRSRRRFLAFAGDKPIEIRLSVVTVPLVVLAILASCRPEQLTWFQRDCSLRWAESYFGKPGLETQLLQGLLTVVPFVPHLATAAIAINILSLFTVIALQQQRERDKMEEWEWARHESWLLKFLAMIGGGIGLWMAHAAWPDGNRWRVQESMRERVFVHGLMSHFAWSALVPLVFLGVSAGQTLRFPPPASVNREMDDVRRAVSILRRDGKLGEIAKACKAAIDSDDEIKARRARMFFEVLAKEPKTRVPKVAFRIDRSVFTSASEFLKGSDS